MNQADTLKRDANMAALAHLHCVTSNARFPGIYSDPPILADAMAYMDRFLSRAGSTDPRKLAAPGSESAEQIALFAWAGLARPLWPKLARLYAYPAGGMRHPATAARMKAEGARASIPDLFLAVMCGGYGGCYIEMKIDKEKPRPDQVKTMAELEAEGYFVSTCWSWEEAAIDLINYLNGKHKRHA